MQKLTIIILAIVFISCTSTPESSPAEVLESGEYLAYYQGEKDGGVPPGHNTIYVDGKGHYELKVDSCTLYIEEFSWKFEDGVLVLFNFDNKSVNTCENKTVGIFEPYTQYFKILKKEGSKLYMQLVKDVFKDGKEKTYEYPKPYVWEKIE